MAPGRGGARLTRAERLPDARAFSYVFAKARASRGRCLTVLARPIEGTRGRLGLVVAKRHAKRAVDRNRIKRLVRESFRHEKLRLAGLSLVVLSKAAATTASNDNLFAELEQHWSRLARR